MNTRSFLFAAIATIATCSASVSAQQFWLVQKLFLPNQVDTHDIGRSFASGSGNVYIGSIGTLSGNDQDGGVYQFDATTLAFERELFSTGNVGDNDFGWTMKYHNGLLLVGAPGQDTERGNTGAAYLFNANTGNIIERFEDFNGQSGDLMGEAVGLEGIVALVGSPFAGPRGRVVLYRTDNLAQFGSLTVPAGFDDEQFGSEIVVNSDYAVISARQSADNSGVVYVLDFVTGVVLHRFVSPNSSTFDGFGGALALDGDTLVVGAQRGGLLTFGAAFIYDLTTGALIETLSDQSGQSAFGRSVDINDQYIIVGASSYFGGLGRISLYNRTTFNLIRTFESPDPFSGESFGQVVKLEDEYILTSNFRNNDPERDVFVIDQFCQADINLDGSLNFLDVSAFIKFAIDFNQDGNFNFLDISAFLASFSEGCP
ncbi:MAG: hypothetical protein AB8C13_09015 [Phycisphaerales bacterium]